MDCSEWTEAAENYFKFQQSRDHEGDNGRFSTWLFHHFEFFQKCKERIKYYSAWKVLERQLRQEYRSNPEPFDGTAYYFLYMQACTSHNLEAKFAKISTPLVPRVNRFSAAPSSVTAHSSRPFRTGDKKTSSPPCCLLCTERGHAIDKHFGASKPSAFADGKPTWAHIHDHELFSPGKQQICIPFNVRRSDRSGCSHAKDVRLHACSWCGSSSHYAFSYTCRSRSSP